MQEFIRARRDITRAAGPAGRRLRGVHAALLRVVGRPRRPLAPVDAAELDDLRRPRRPRRLEHVRRRGGGTCRRRLVGGADHRRAHVLLDLPAPRQPLAGGARRERAVPQVRARRRTREPTLRAFAQAADREADGGQGHDVVVPARLRPGAAAGHRLALRPRPDRGPPLDGQRPGVRLDRGAGRGRRASTTSSSATSMPWLLPRALHDIESLERGALRPGRADGWSRGWRRLVRRAVDLEHWAAFRRVLRPARRLCSSGSGGASTARRPRRRSASCRATSTTPTCARRPSGGRSPRASTS